MIYGERRSTQFRASPLTDTFMDEDIQKFSRYKVRNITLLATMQMLIILRDLQVLIFKEL